MSETDPIVNALTRRWPAGQIFVEHDYRRRCWRLQQAPIEIVLLIWPGGHTRLQVWASTGRVLYAQGADSWQAAMASCPF